jgi:hypothetical protein
LILILLQALGLTYPVTILPVSKPIPEAASLPFFHGPMLYSTENVPEGIQVPGNENIAVG